MPDGSRDVSVGRADGALLLSLRQSAFQAGPWATSNQRGDVAGWGVVWAEREQRGQEP